MYTDQEQQQQKESMKQYNTGYFVHSPNHDYAHDIVCIHEYIIYELYRFNTNWNS